MMCFTCLIHNFTYHQRQHQPKLNPVGFLSVSPQWILIIGEITEQAKTVNHKIFQEKSKGSKKA